MEIDLVGEGLKFMVLGMAIVFAFLLVLVQVVKLQAKIINKMFPQKEVVKETSSTDKASEEQQHVAAIIAAVTEFRKK